MGVASLWVKQQRCEDDHLVPSITEVKNGWAIPPVPPNAYLCGT
jgi:hypothetical protein